MAKYTHYTEQQKEQARMTDIADLLRRQGEKVKRAGSEQEWLDGSQKVSRTVTELFTAEVTAVVIVVIRTLAITNTTNITNMVAIIVYALGNPCSTNIAIVIGVII